MAEFVPHGELLDEVEAATVDRPPAIVANAHITGPGVARALTANDVPVIAIDRTGTGAAPPSTSVAFAGAVTYPLDDQAGFRADIEAIAETVGNDLIAVACMDEWVHAVTNTDPVGVRFPFADRSVIDAVLDTSSLYRIDADLGVPFPETRWSRETDVDTAIADLGLPLEVKPALKREFAEVSGTNVLEVGTAAELRDVVAMAEAADIEVLAQEKPPIAGGPRPHSRLLRPAERRR